MVQCRVKIAHSYYLIYLQTPLCEEQHGLVYSLYFSHFNTQIKRGLNGIKISLLTLGLNLALGNAKFDIRVGAGFVPNLGWRHWGNSFWVTIRDEELKMGSMDKGLGRRGLGRSRCNPTQKLDKIDFTQCISQLFLHMITFDLTCILAIVEFSSTIKMRILFLQFKIKLLPFYLILFFFISTNFLKKFSKFLNFSHWFSHVTHTFSTTPKMFFLLPILLASSKKLFLFSNSFFLISFSKTYLFIYVCI
jgi:hypothetical protein